LRFDPEYGASNGSFGIDYIGIQENPWEFASTVEGWKAQYCVNGFSWQTGGYVGGTIIGTDPQIVSGTNLGIDITSHKIIKIKLKNGTASATGQIFFITNADGVYNAAKHKDFAIQPNSDYTEYTIDMSTVAGWTGTLKQLRFDPEHGASGGSFGVDYVRIQETDIGLGKRVVACYRFIDKNSTTNYYDSDLIPYSKLSHIIHTYIRPKEDGGLDIPNGFIEPNLTAKAHASGENGNGHAGGVKVKVLVSINGTGSNSDILANIASDPNKRDAFAANLEAFCRNNDYDGIDMDWEYPKNATDRGNFTLLMQAIRARFDSTPDPAPSWIISLDLTGANYWSQWIDIQQIDSSVSFYNLMCYDMHGAWSDHSGHNAALYDGTDPCAGMNMEGYVNYLINVRNVSAAKINVGVPFYGWKYIHSEDLYDNGNGDMSTVPVFYRDIAPIAGNGWTQEWDQGSSVPYLTNDAGAGLISYDDPTSTALKVKYALFTRNVGGIFIYEISFDYNPAGQPSQPLLDAVYGAVPR